MNAAIRSPNITIKKANLKSPRAAVTPGTDAMVDGGIDVRAAHPETLSGVGDRIVVPA